MIFRKSKTIDDEIHDYTDDLVALEKLLGTARQHDILQKTDDSKRRVETIQGEIDICHKVLTRLLTQRAGNEG